MTLVVTAGATSGDALDATQEVQRGGDLESFFMVLRDQAFTRAVDDANRSPCDGLGLDADWITIETDENGTDVRACTRTLHDHRHDAFTDAERLLDAITNAGPWTPYRGGWIGIHPDRKYTAHQPTNESNGRFAAIHTHLQFSTETHSG